MEIIRMNGYQGHANYCSAYNDCSPPDLPRFNSVKTYIRHAETICQGSENTQNKDHFYRFVQHANDSHMDNKVE